MFRLPNLLTMSRILLVPVFVVAFLLHTETARLIAFAVFCLAGASDALDGFAARQMNAGSDFGRMLDPIADKILVATALMLLVADDAHRRLPADRGARSSWHANSSSRACANFSPTRR